MRMVRAMPSTADVRTEPPPPVAPSRRPFRHGAYRWAVAPAPVALVTVLAAAVVLRFVAAGPLWLDEAQSVAIARRPPAELLRMLRHDGSPPLYYLLLHAWMAAVGTGTFAVRALSSILSVATLPVTYVLGRRLVDRAYARDAVLLLAVIPFA